MRLIVSFEFVDNSKGKAKVAYRGMEPDIHVSSMKADDIEYAVPEQWGYDIGSALADYDEVQFVILNIIKTKD